MTLKGVAKRARVSAATVSRVLNGLDVVKESTRKRVLQAIEELNYHPNLHARSLAGGKLNTLGMIVSNLRNPFFVDIFSSTEAAARERGYEVLVEHTDYNPLQLVAGVHLLLGRRVAGLAVIASEMDQAVMQQITDSRLPAVFYDVGLPGPKITNIRVRYEIGMQRMVQYLYDLGHRRMAFLGHHPSLAPLQTRKQAFIETMRRYSQEVEFATAENDDDPAGAMHATYELLSSGFKPTAIVCVNDYMAIGAMRAARSRGLSVPRDLSITGFDNIQLSQFTDPPLTTVNIPREAIGQMAVEALLQEEPSLTGREISIEPELMLRDSTGPVKAIPVRHRSA